MVLEKLSFGYSFDQIKYDYDITDEDIKESRLYNNKIGDIWKSNTR